MSHYRNPARSALSAALLLTICLLLQACSSGPRTVRGADPLIDLEGVSRNGSALGIDVMIRNVNDLRLEADAVSLRLHVDGRLLAQVDAQIVELNLPPRGREILRIEALAMADAVAALDELAGGQRRNLPWDLELYFDGRRGRVEASGFLHAVPGQPGRFR